MREVWKVEYSQSDITLLFFKDLKQYNTTNFKQLVKADLTKTDAMTHKAFSSVITRYFIFCERHADIPTTQLKMLHYKLKIDLIGKYLSEYPDAHLDYLKPFQTELLTFIQDNRPKTPVEVTTDVK